MSMGKSPLEILNSGEDWHKPYLLEHWITIGCGVLGFGSAFMLNYGLRRPLASGIQNHLLYATLGAGFGYWLNGKRNNYLAERDAILRHYVELHPADFPTPERKKWGEVLTPWVPIR